jgi:hypothetical protein
VSSSCILRSQHTLGGTHTLSSCASRCVTESAPRGLLGDVWTQGEEGSESDNDVEDSDDDVEDSDDVDDAAAGDDDDGNDDGNELDGDDEGEGENGEGDESDGDDDDMAAIDHGGGGGVAPLMQPVAKFFMDMLKMELGSDDSDA